MRRAAKIDRNQPEIVKALKQAGASVLHLHTVGHGCPDLLVDFRGRTMLMEVKDGEQTPSKRALTTDEQGFAAWWSGPLYIVKSVEDAMRALAKQ